MRKLILTVIINILLISIILFAGEILTYKYQAKIFYDTHPKLYPINKYSYEIFYPDYMTDLKNYYNGKNNLFYGRKPDGVEYKNKTPITIFGCSFAFGQHLNFNQTFSYKLAHKLKRPVHNRAISGGSFQHTYMQTTNKTFYEDIPYSDTVIYVMIGDHYRRTMLDYFDVLDHHVLPHYTIKNNKLVMDNYKNKLLNLYKSLYITKSINHIFADNYIQNEKNAEKITDSAVLYFTESRKELQKHWGKDFKFIIVLYEVWQFPYKELLQKKLENNGFIVFSTLDLTSENLNSEKYMMLDNYHPTEAAWDLLTPKFIEKAFND